ncbi:MAG: class I SAM-dependent methyltransferase [Chloroflexi bacterium]|nr:class I SAM-dependent methyltransferase [Chloroflexota bacterium]
MNLLDVVRRQPTPMPWVEGEKIPWHEPAFSARMLNEHLSQQHDAASRRTPVIEQHVAWIHHDLLENQPTRILDLGCGPGLYASRLARRGHECVGIDFSPASIAYAREQAAAERLACRYIEADLRALDFGARYGLVMFVFGELNAFRPDDARRILRKARNAMAEDGRLLLEVSTFEGVRNIGSRLSGWYSSERGLFSDRPHLGLFESFWDDAQAVATKRYFIVDAESGAVTRCTASTQAYTEEQYRALLTEAGFSNVEFYPRFGDVEIAQKEFLVIVARTREANSE